MSQAERPRIEVVRVSSTERAKILPLLEGGVQLQAQFKHHLSNNYASCSSLDDATRRYRDAHSRHFRYEGGKSPRREHRTTKSCDNIFAGQLEGRMDQDNPFTWHDATRSEEHLCRDAHNARCSILPVGDATKSEGHIHQITRMSVNTATPLRSRFRLITFLKKLSPRPKRFSNKVLRAQNVFPWVVVEFTNKDLGPKNEQPAMHVAGRCNSEDSTASDKSFAMAVKINRLRKQQTLASKLQEKEQTHPGYTKVTAAPRIVIASPGLGTTLPLRSDECKSPCRNSLPRGEDSGNLGSPLRPHSLKLQSGQPTCPSLSLTPDARVQHRMASFESIGNCSLDAEVTASEASENEDSASERTLRSLSLLTKTPEADCPCKSVPGGASTPEYVKRTARLFETSTCDADSRSGAVNGKQTDSCDANCEKVVTNGTGVAGKKPSYLGLACSISGYSGITTYDSKLREGFRSRDQSPGRIGLIASREASPLRHASEKSEVVAVHSECGNFLVPPTRGITRFVVGTPSSVSDGFIQTLPPYLLTDKLTQNISDTFVNGFEKFDAKRELCTSVKEQDMGDKSTSISSDGYMKNGSSEISRNKLIDDCRTLNTISKDNFPRESLSDTIATIRESSRHFMSSMLSSSSFSAISSESSFDRPRAEELKYSPTLVQVNQEESSVKFSPHASKTSSKDSIGAPVTSPLKRSPGAVRVVEFTSQSKSYVKTVSTSSAFMETSPSFPSHSVDSSGTQEQVADSPSSNVMACKSFIQQRVERLYGPGALAQGFFIRTKCLHKEVDEQGSEDVPDADFPLTATSSPALPVLRHLRPEFRAQLSVAVPSTRRTYDDFCPEGQVTVIPVHVEKSTDVPVLQHQASVESVTDLQPAAPEVVLPIDQSQVVPNKIEPDVISLKDGHFFLNLLKQELDRLDSLASGVEADLEQGDNVPEEVLGKLRAAAGQARLLMRQKMQQFEGLCHKNLAQSSDEPFPTTSEDLAGFWDMVMLQVEQVNRLFAEIAVLRANNWIQDKTTHEVPPESIGVITSKRQLTPAKKALSKPVRQETSKHADAARKAREDARRKMMEQRRRVMREKAAAASMSADVEIFVPLENGKRV